MGDPGQWTVTYAYEPDGARRSVTYPSGIVVNDTGRNLVATISADGPPPLATFIYTTGGPGSARGRSCGKRDPKGERSGSDRVN